MLNRQDTSRRNARTAVVFLVVLVVALVLGQLAPIQPTGRGVYNHWRLCGSLLGRRTLKSGYTELPPDSTKRTHDPL